MILTTYFYHATVINVHDGDTLHLNVDLRRAVPVVDKDLGFHVYVEHRGLHLHEDFRLFGINAPELSTPEGAPATEFLKSLLGPSLLIQTVKQGDHEKQEKFGRWLATIWSITELAPTWNNSINQQMITNGHAVPFMQS